MSATRPIASILYEQLIALLDNKQGLSLWPTVFSGAAWNRSGLACLLAGLASTCNASSMPSDDGANRDFANRQRLIAAELANDGIDRNVPAPRLRISSENDAGARCEHALILVDMQPSTVELASRGRTGDSVWFLWQAPRAGLFAVSTAGSGTDSSLELHDHCGGVGATPVAKSEPVIGGVAVLPIDAEYPGQEWWVKTSSAEAAGTVLTTIASSSQIVGRVTEAISGAPLDGHRVEARRIDGLSFGPAFTDSNGTYEIVLFNPPASAQYVVRTRSFEGNDPLVEEFWNDVPCGASINYNESICGTPTPILIAAGETRTGIDFALGPGVTLTGRVFSRLTGEAVAGATVRIVNATRDIRSLLTDSSGRFRALGLTADTYYAIASSPSFRSSSYRNIPCDESAGCSPRSGTPIVIATGTAAPIDFVLDPMHFIEADVQLDGDRIAFSLSPSFELFFPNGAAVDTYFLPDGNGRYRIGPVVPGNSYLLKARNPFFGFAQLYAGVDCVSDCVAERSRATPIAITYERPLAPISMNLRRLPRLSGRVLDATTGALLPFSQVYLYPTGSPSSRLETPATTGDFSFEGIAPGDYFVVAEAMRYVNQIYPGVACEFPDPVASCPSAQALRFSLNSGDLSVDFRLDRGNVISGRFTSSGSNMPGGTDFDFSSVSLFDTAGRLVGGTRLTIDTLQNSYAISDFSVGTYVVAASVRGFYAQVFDRVDCPIGDSTFSRCPFGSARRVDGTVSVGSVDFDLRQSGSHIVEVRSQPNGAAIAGVSIDAWDSNGRPLGSATSGSDGRALIRLSNEFSAQIPVRLSTDNYLGFDDEVFDNIRCPTGTSVFRGGCSLQGGQTVMLPNTEPTAARLSVFLTPAPIIDATVFRSGFE